MEDNPPLTQTEIEQLKKELEATKAPEGGFYSIQEVEGLGARIVRVEEVAGIGRVIRETGAWLGTPQEVLEPMVTRVPVTTAYKAAPPKAGEPLPSTPYAGAPLTPPEELQKAIGIREELVAAAKETEKREAMRKIETQLLQEQAQKQLAQQMQEQMGLQATRTMIAQPEVPRYTPTVITKAKPEVVLKLETEKQMREMTEQFAKPTQATMRLLEPQILPKYVPTTIEKYVPPTAKVEKEEPLVLEQFMIAFKEMPIGKFAEAMTYSEPIPIAAEKPKDIAEAIGQFGATATALTLSGIGALGRGAIFFLPSTALFAESLVRRPEKTVAAIGAGIAETAPKAAYGFELLGKKAVTGELAVGEAAFLGEFAKAAVEFPFMTAGAMAAGTMIGKGVTLAREKLAEMRGFEPQRAVVEYVYAYEQPELERAFGVTAGKGEITAIGKQIKIDFESEFLAKRLPAELREQFKGIEDVGVSIGKMRTTIEQPRFFGLLGKKVTTFEEPFAEFYVAGKPVYQMPLQSFEEIGKQFAETGGMVYQLRPAPLGVRPIKAYQVAPEFKAERLISEKLFEAPLDNLAEGMRGTSELYWIFGENLEAYQFVKRFTLTPPIDVKVFKPSGVSTTKPLYDVGTPAVAEPVTTLAVPTVAKQVGAALEKAMETKLPPVLGAADIIAPAVTTAAMVSKETYAPVATAAPKAAEKRVEITMPSFEKLGKMDLGVTLAPALRGRETITKQLDVGALLIPTAKAQLREESIEKQLERQLTVTIPALGLIPQERLVPSVVPKTTPITAPVEIPAIGEITLEVPELGAPDFGIAPPPPPPPPPTKFPPVGLPFEERIRIMPRKAAKPHKGKKYRRPSKYVPSLIGLVLGGTIPKAPKGVLTGVEIRYPVAPRISQSAEAKVAKRGRVSKTKKVRGGLFWELEKDLRRFGL